MQRLVVLLVLLFTLASCSSRYAVTKSKLEDSYFEKDFKKTSKLLDKSKVYQKKRNAILYNMEKGKLMFLQNKHEASNKYFNEADLQIEDFKKSAGNQALSYLVNDLMMDYQPKDFEVLGIYYYKALNYLALGDYEASLVEARRMNIYLNKMDDRYKKVDKNYAKDAFTHNLMGIIYEQSGDDNNAFIAYRNAVNIYLEHDDTYLNVEIPKQLQIDLLQTSKRVGFTDEFERFNKMFKIDEEELNQKNVLVFWENGLAPQLGYETLDFSMNSFSDDRQVEFNNRNFDQPFVSQLSKGDFDKISHLSSIRINIPTYYPRTSAFTGELIYDGETTSLELAEDYFSIAKKLEKSTLDSELSKILLRQALKIGARTAIVSSIENAEEKRDEKREEEQRQAEIEYEQQRAENDDNSQTEVNDFTKVKEAQPTDEESEVEEKENTKVYAPLPEEEKSSGSDIPYSAIANLLLGAYNYASEQPDTRQWIGLPSEIYYSRVAKTPTSKEMSLQVNGQYLGSKQNIQPIELRENLYYFITF